MSTRKLNATQLRKFRSEVARLKALGLTSARVDARKQRNTRYMRGQVAKFRDVLEGKAQVVKVPKRAAAREFSDKYRTKGKAVVIPTAKGERARYAPTEGAISVTKKIKGKTVKRKLYATEEKRSKAMRKYEKRKNVLFVIPLGDTRQSFDRWEDLVLFMEPYETNPQNPYRDWERYVEIVQDGDDE